MATIQRKINHTKTLYKVLVELDKKAGNSEAADVALLFLHIFLTVARVYCCTTSARQLSFT